MFNCVTSAYIEWGFLIIPCITQPTNYYRWGGSPALEEQARQYSNTLQRVEGERAKTGLQMFLHKARKSRRDSFLLPSRSFRIQEQQQGDQTQCPFFMFCLILCSDNCLWKTCGTFMQCTQWQWICFHNSVQLQFTLTLFVLLYLPGNPKVQNTQAPLVR